jgi:prepilin-type N-terminal cleavage/methylation domain-containing protein
VNRRAFSLVELVIVVVIIGIIGAIAIARAGSMVENARASRIAADAATLNSAADLFAQEHQGISVARHPDGTLADDSTIIARLTGNSDDSGNPDPVGLYGPYLRRMPPNAGNGLECIRIDLDPLGSNICAWRYDSLLETFQSDYSE